MSGGLPHHQHISGVSTQNHSQAFVGSATNVYFAGSNVPQEASEQAASACRNALFLTDPTIDRESLISARGTRVAGTCEWITHHKSYRAWLNGGGDGSNNDGTRLLWISGGPGKGKTMLSVFLTQELEEHTTSIEAAELLFFFCSAQDEKRNTAVAVLRGLVHQMVVKRPQLIKHALPYFETHERTQQTLWSLETLWIIFRKLIADVELGTMFCVIDGLDECEESTLRVLLPRLVGLLAGGAPFSTKGIFMLAIVSRDISALQGCTQVRLDPDNDDKVVGDIALFVSARVRELPRIEGFNDEFRFSMQTALLARAEGTFLWVGFAMHELSQMQTCSDIWEALEDLPRGLPAIYNRMLLRIPASRRETSRVILRWVTMAARPLKLQELAAAAGVRSLTPRTTTEQAIRDAITHCGPLLKVQEQEVSLVHQSVRDYLLRKECDNDAVLEAFRLDFERENLQLAQKCLDCIAQSGLQHKAINLDAEPDPQDSALLRYATSHWPEHARSCSTLATKLLNRPAPFFQGDSLLRVHWWETYANDVQGIPRRPPPLLHMACTLEIIPWIEVVLEKKSWWPSYHRRVDEKDDGGNTALHWVAWRGNEAIVRLLVDRGADIKAKGNSGETVLHRAASAWRENEEVVRLLLDRGADVKAKDNAGHTVLHMAAAGGRKEAVVRLLIDRGADVKAKDNAGHTVLYMAAAAGRKEAVVRLLIDRGADVEAKDKNGDTVLHWAALRGHDLAVRLLIHSGANFKAKDNNGVTVLHAAAWGGYIAVVELLLKSGAEVKAKDNNGETALQLAARRGHNSVVQLLINSGADVKVKDNEWWTALSGMLFGKSHDVA